jgi:hypothetical protein
MTNYPELKSSFDVPMIKKYIELVQMEIIKQKELGKNTPFDLELCMMETFPEFYQSNPFLVKRLCKQEDLTVLYKMLDNLEQVENGDKSLASVEMNLGMELANQFLYPHINKN